MELRADLHIHTTASDGAVTPAEVVAIGHRAGLAGMAITDHDTVDGLKEAMEAGASLGIKVLSGVEISTIYGDKTEVHILGYCFDHTFPALVECLQVLKKARLKRGREMVNRLNEAGVAVCFDRVLEIACGGAVGRPHVARAICEVGAASSMDCAFGRFLQEGGVAYVPRYKLTPAEAIEQIKAAGGVACCAHVGKLKRGEMLAELVDQGLQAIEVYHPDHTSAVSRFYKRFAAKRGLIATGGSDAHCFPGSAHPGIGRVTVSYDAVIQLEDAASLNTDIPAPGN